MPLSRIVGRAFAATVDNPTLPNNRTGEYI